MVIVKLTKFFVDYILRSWFTRISNMKCKLYMCLLFVRSFARNRVSVNRVMCHRHGDDMKET